MRSDASAPNTNSRVAADRVGAADVLASTAALPRSASTQPTAAWNDARADQVADAQRRADQVGEALDLVGAARRADRHLPAHACRAAGRGRPGAGPGRRRSVSLNAREHAGLRQRQRIARALQRPELAAVERVEGLHACGRRRARRRARRPPAARSRRAMPSGLRHFTWPASSATSSPSRVTTAAKRPSLPTPARELAADARRARARGRCRRRARARVPSLAADRERAARRPPPSAGTGPPSMRWLQTWRAGDLRRQRLERRRLRLVGRRSRSRRPAAPAATASGQTRPSTATRARHLRRIAAALAARPPAPRRAR